MEKIIIVGYGGHAKSVLDAIEEEGRYEIAGFVDKDMEHIFPYRGYKVIGTDNDYQELYDSGIRHACMGIGFMGNGELREKLHRILKDIGFDFPVIKDPSAIIARDAKIGEGCFIGKNSIINADAEIGELAIINTGALIEHECKVGGYSHIAVAAVLCGAAEVGLNCMIGANSTVIQGVKITDEVIVGAGSVVVKDIEDSGTWIGNPCRKL